MKSTGVVFPQANTCVLEAFDVGEPGVGELLIETSFTTLSPGT